MSGFIKPKPNYIRPRLDDFPPFMRILPNWVMWRAELREDRWTKVPYVADLGLRKAASDDPQTWATFEQACELTDKGIHGIAKGSIPLGRREWKRGEHQGIAFYDQKRYLTVSGHIFEPRVLDVVDQSAAITSLWQRIFSVTISVGQRRGQDPKQTASIGDSTLIQRALAAKDGGKFAKLWHGEWQGGYPSQSEADAALLRESWPTGPGKMLPKSTGCFVRAVLCAKSGNARTTATVLSWNG